jgi:hypothetical protein
MYTLNKWADTLAPGATAESSALAQHMMIFVASGSATINGVKLIEGGATNVEDFLAIAAGSEGATIKAIADFIFGQDKPVLEAQQRLVGDHDLFDLSPVSFSADRLTVEARRILNRLIGVTRSAELSAVD